MHVSIYIVQIRFLSCFLLLACLHVFLATSPTSSRLASSSASPLHISTEFDLMPRTRVCVCARLCHQADICSKCTLFFSEMQHTHKTISFFASIHSGTFQMKLDAACRIQLRTEALGRVTQVRVLICMDKY